MSPRRRRPSLEPATPAVYNPTADMNPRRHCLLACAVLAACFSPTGNTETSAETAVTSGASTTASDPSTTTSSTTWSASTGTTSAGTASPSSATATTIPDNPSTGSEPCGDGQVDDGEECDPNDPASMDGCSGACTKEFRRVFVTSEVFTADLGDLPGADEKCQTAATLAGLPGTYLAWLSSPSGSPAGRFVRSKVPYQQVNGVVVADNWDDLVDGMLIAGIVVSEVNGSAGKGVHNCPSNGSAIVWTNTKETGAEVVGDWHCGEWGGTSGAGVAGRPGSINSSWSQDCSADCQSQAALYCFEQ